LLFKLGGGIEFVVCGHERGSSNIPHRTLRHVEFLRLFLRNFRAHLDRCHSTMMGRVLLLFVLAAHSASCGGLRASMPTSFVAQTYPTRKSANVPTSRRAGASPARHKAAVRLFRMNADDDGLERGDHRKGKLFVSRKLTDALLDTTLGMPTPALESVQGSAERPSKRAMVKNAATKLLSFLFRSSEDAPPMGGQAIGAEFPGGQWRSPSSVSRVSNTKRVSAEAQAEHDRVFDLLNKYSQRHSNGTVPLTTISAISERKTVQKSKYANLYNPEADESKRQSSKSGKLLQKSKYADVWSAQDQVLNKPSATKSQPAPKAVTKPVYSARPLTTAVPSTSSGKSLINRQAGPAEPPSRLEQLMNSYSTRYPTDARSSTQDDNRLLRRGGAQPSSGTLIKRAGAEAGTKSQDDIALRCVIVLSSRACMYVLFTWQHNASSACTHTTQDPIYTYPYTYTCTCM
jgi:hypothetical protein